MGRCEQLVQDAARDNKLAWPPTYAEFIGYCQPPKEDPVPALYRELPAVLPEPKEHKEKRRQVGITKCKGLMDLLNE